MSKQLDFIDKIQPYVDKYVKQYGYGVTSAIIAQAAYESGWGTSPKAINGYNFFGMRYRSNISDYYIENGKVSRYDGRPITDTMWCAAKSLDEGIEMYFKFIGKTRYAEARKQTSPTHYLRALHEANYCSDLTYVNNIMKIVDFYKLTDFDELKGRVPPFYVVCKDDLNIRTSPEMGDNILVKNGCLKYGKYTIVEVQGSWGLLKSYAKNRNGWITINRNYVNY